MPYRAAAVDLGATSGRVVVGDLGPNGIRQHVVARFPTRSSRDERGRLRWCFDELYAQACAALADVHDLHSVGVDSWAVDYGLLGDDGALLAAPRNYRDEAHRAEYERAFADPARRRQVYSRTGIALQPFNTLVQTRTDDLLPAARHLLLIPDLFAHRLCGVLGTELTNASTTQLLDARSRTWSPTMTALAGLRRDQLTDLHEPGTRLGVATIGTSPVEVVAVGSHDTASAVAGTPLASADEAYVSCGSWALIGVETERPMVSERALRANLTNELGVAGRVRLLKNVTGLWLVERCLDVWRRTDPDVNLSALATAAADVRTTAYVDPDDVALLTVHDVPAAITELCAAQGTRPPDGPAETVRCLFQSMARAWREALGHIDEAQGRTTRSVRLVGGGAAIDLLAQLAADELGIPVHAGPVEATAAGNLVVQAISAGVYADLDAARATLRASFPSRSFRPR